MQVLNFYSTIFADELKRGRKTATIRLGDKSGKYRKNQAVLVTIGYQYSPRERIFEAVIDQVEVMKLADLSPRDIKHDNPEFRRHEELINFLEQIYGRTVSTRGHRHGRALLADPREPHRHDRGDQGLRRRPELDRRRRAGTATPRCSWHVPRKTARIFAWTLRRDLLYIEGAVGTLPSRVPTEAAPPVAGPRAAGRTL